ncbi:hypothetical protein L2E82_47939 [Cichorium intybus]|uniref:Uncharacterized protein n=1 Tax=Cichorium intybus TaxID=13427 RepID=A0ACB8YXE9_CICIN|nr:hypothetical protein L2E82_47939 [Cichorium intybus]
MLEYFWDICLSMIYILYEVVTAKACDLSPLSLYLSLSLYHSLASRGRRNPLLHTDPRSSSIHPSIVLIRTGADS